MSIITDWFRALDAVVDRELRRDGDGDGDPPLQEFKDAIADLQGQVIDERQKATELQGAYSLTRKLQQELEQENELLENKLNRIGSILASRGLGAEQCEEIKRIIGEPSRLEAEIESHPERFTG